MLRLGGVLFYMEFSWECEQLRIRIQMKEKKTRGVGVRLNETQEAYLQKLISEGRASTISGAIQYLINQQVILGGK